jgi:hypothetical protein
MPKESTLANHTIGELQIGDKTGAMIFAILSSEVKFRYHSFGTRCCPSWRHPHSSRYLRTGCPSRNPRGWSRADKRRLLKPHPDLRSLTISNTSHRNQLET